VNETNEKLRIMAEEIILNNLKLARDKAMDFVNCEAYQCSNRF